MLARNTDRSDDPGRYGVGHTRGVDRPDAGQRTLVLLRHAKSDWTHDVPDVDRPLASRGRRQAPEAGRWLDAHLDHIDLAVVSPARRARSTWELVTAELSVTPEVMVDDRVYAASEAQLLAVVREIPDDRDTAVLVGHNPGLEELLGRLTGSWTALPTSAIAVVRLAGGWASAGEASGALLASGRPPAG
jgi:phosphohistidine phosphatase